MFRQYFTSLLLILLSIAFNFSNFQVNNGQTIHRGPRKSFIPNYSAWPSQLTRFPTFCDNHNNPHLLLSMSGSLVLSHKAHWVAFELPFNHPHDPFLLALTQAKRWNSDGRLIIRHWGMCLSASGSARVWVGSPSFQNLKRFLRGIRNTRLRVIAGMLNRILRSEDHVMKLR